MTNRRQIFRTAAALTLMVSAATSLFWGAIALFNKKDEEKNATPKGTSQKKERV